MTISAVLSTYLLCHAHLYDISCIRELLFHPSCFMEPPVCNKLIFIYQFNNMKLLLYAVKKPIFYACKNCTSDHDSWLCFSFISDEEHYVFAGTFLPRITQHFSHFQWNLLWLCKLLVLQWGYHLHCYGFKFIGWVFPMWTQLLEQQILIWGVVFWVLWIQL